MKHPSAPIHRWAAILPAITLLILSCSLGAQTEAKHRGNYLLSPDDLVEIKVFQEDDLHTTARISRDGMIVFPLVGPVKIGGVTVERAAAILRERLQANQLVDPQVNVTVMEYAKRRFTVLGEVQRPGAYEIPDRDSLNLLEAIGMAGGFTRIAQPAKVTLKREVQGRERVYKLNAKKMAHDPATPTFLIRPNDIITVGERLF